MTATLAKGANLLLTDEAPGIQRLRVGLGWSLAPGAGSAPMEMDGLVSLVGPANPAGRLLLTHQLPNPEESMGAALARGPIVGDAEKIVVSLAAVPADVTRLLFGSVIFDARARHQSFRSVRGAYIRLLNDDNGIELARYTLEQVTESETAMIFGEVYRNPKGWKFRAVGQGYASGLQGVVGPAGMNGDNLPTARPVEVTDYLRRSSTARSHRSLAEHLDPPKASPTPPPAAPKPPDPAPGSKAAPKPAPRPAPKPAPKPAAKAAPSPAPAKPAAERPAPSRPAPRPKPAAPPAPARSSGGLLDLSEPEPAPAASPPRGRARGSGGRPIVFGEHSSRYRQRTEHVSALDDDHPATVWTEDDRGSGRLTVTLRWEPLKTSTGLPRPSDLQLGCFWQAMDKASGVMQTVGSRLSAPGELGPRQVLALGRRDEQEGQTIFVDLAALPSFKRFFVFVYGQHGTPEWPLLRPVLTVTAPSGEELTIRPGDAAGSAQLCVLASFHVFQGDLIIRRENDFLDGVQSEAAAKYGWSLEWEPDGMTPR